MKRRRSVPIAVGLLIAFAAHASYPDDVRTEIRVGLLAFEGQFEDWQTILAGFEAADPRYEYRVALGTYAELLHWMEEGWVDVAVLSPALFAIGSDPREYPRIAASFRYLATVGYIGQRSDLGQDSGGAVEYQHTYRSVCVVRSDSQLLDFGDVLAAYATGQLVFVFGHPLSTSGRIAPEHALRRGGVAPDPERIEYTHSHTNTLVRIAGSPTNVVRVGFVYEQSLEANRDLAASVRILPFPELDERELPWDVVVLRSELAHLESFGSQVLAYRDAAGRRRFKRFEDWKARYDAVRSWQEEIGLDWDPHAGLSMSLEEIGGYLEHTRRTQPKPPKLAVVLSGGGARCSYQVGVLAALEEELERLRERDPENAFDIDLVVGTSGGAINALPVALGVTATAQGRKDFEDVWTSLDQREVIDFSPVLRGSIGLWAGILRIALLIVLIRLFVRRRAARAWWLSALLVASALLEAVLQRVEVPWDWMGANHWRHHIWMWLSQGHGASTALLASAGVVIAAIQLALRRRNTSLRLSRPWFVAVLVFALTTLPLVSGYQVLLGEETLSEGTGIERAMAEGMSHMIQRHAERETGTPLNLGSDVPVDRLRELSREIHERGLFRRDLVVTASCLEQSKKLLPDDLYFFARSEPAPGPSPLGRRGIPLRRFPERTLEVIMGSGAIFPLFPERTLHDFPVAGESVRLIDGGFAHNSPIEAAVLWGATHIILIEASPVRTGRGRGLAANVVSAVQHYARQTEQVDRRSSKEVVVFTLSPEEPHPCLLDFADNLIRATIDKGYDDARGLQPGGDSFVSRRRFVKQGGKPVFASVAR